MDITTSILLEKAINQLTQLPGVGKKTAFRYATKILSQSQSEYNDFIEAIDNLKKKICYCKICNAISDDEICPICMDKTRNHQLICVVESIRDMIALENTRQYRGLYHVLGGILSPIEGIGVHDLAIPSLLKRVEEKPIQEIILALPTTVEGDTTNFYLNKILKGKAISITTIARGIAIGDNLEYADEITLGRSILHRTPFDEVFR